MKLKSKTKSSFLIFAWITFFLKCSLSEITSTTDESINKTLVERFMNFVADKNITFVFKEKELDFYKDECIINQTNVPFELVKEGNKVEFIQ